MFFSIESKPVAVGFMKRTLLILFCFFAFISSHESKASDPGTVVEEFQKHLLSVMKQSKSLTVKERYDLLLPAIEGSFQLHVMIGIAAGSYWKTANREQRERLANAFKRKNISTVATLFRGYSGQVFETLGEKEAPQNTQLVQTQIVSPDGDAIELDYRLIETKNGWKIIDVIIDKGISEMSVRRSEYNDILKKGGISALIDILNGKADELLAEK
jgi:phospholipid transport system substrate-binding protein